LDPTFVYPFPHFAYGNKIAYIFKIKTVILVWVRIIFELDCAIRDVTGVVKFSYNGELFKGRIVMRKLGK